VSGAYRVYVAKPGKIKRIAVLRASLMPGFDTAAATAIRAASKVDDVMSIPEGDDSMVVDINFSIDSVAGARRLATAWFPRMPVVDASALADNPTPKFPDEARQEGFESGDIVLRFVVDRQGEATPGTVELVRGHSVGLLRAAVAALPSQRFTPARIHGCAVAQVVEYVFNFLSPEPPLKH
jgi:outer membrane biosynthesis protein TonB